MLLEEFFVEGELRSGSGERGEGVQMEGVFTSVARTIPTFLSRDTLAIVPTYVRLGER